MKKHISLLLTIISVGFLVSCGGKHAQKKLRTAKGGINYGGVFRYNEVEDFRHLFPPNITEVASFRIGYQVYDGLVKFSQKDLSIQPALAEKWEVNENATKFKFYLRKGVKFHDDPCFPDGKGREVTAEDVKYCFDFICSAHPLNQMFWLVKDRVVGANEYHEASKSGNPPAEGVKGIKVIDKYTIEIELERPFAGFLNIMGHSAFWIYPKEAFEKYGDEMRVKMVGTGPFRVKTIKEGEVVILERNPDYYGVDEHGNQLPYIDAIKVSFLKEKKSELLEFRKGNLDMVFKLPLEMIDQVVGELEEAKSGGNIEYYMQNTPALAVQYYGFQHKSDLFSNKYLRLAFNYAIDRKKLVDFTLRGDGQVAEYGIVPKGFKKYQYDSLKGYRFDPELAKEYLAKAGYPGGKGLPEITLNLNSGGSINIQVAEAIQSMLKENLGVNLKLEVMPFAQHLENLETGKAMFFRTAWVADYPDPENFLNLLYGKNVPESLSEKSYINSVRYQNAKFDSLFEKALQTVDNAERYRLYRMADQVQLDDAAVMPIYYDEFTRLISKKVKNFPANAMEIRDLSTVYFKDDK